MNCMHYLAFDTETTGVRSNAQIVELAVVFFTNGEVVETWDSLFWPEGADFDDPDVRKALEVNGVTPEDLEGKPTFSESLPDIKRALDGEQIWVAHNTPFDLRMLGYEFERAGVEMPKPGYAFDTMMLDRALDKYRKGKRTMEKVAEVWDVELVDAHRARVDATACGKVFWAMTQSGRLPPSVETAYAAQALARKEWDAYIEKKYGRK
jgi:DNA polymerase-3 subunit epsilon